MTIEKAMNVFRQLQTRSHSFASAFGSVSAAVTIMILPSLATSIRAISTPAAIAARIARVTSCCRNVEGARPMATTVKSAYRSLQIVQAVARGSERGLAVGRHGAAPVEEAGNVEAGNGCIFCQPPRDIF